MEHYFYFQGTKQDIAWEPMEVIGLLFIFSLLQIFFHMQQHIDSNRMKNWKITN